MRTISKTADPGALDLTNLSRDLTAWRRTHRPPSPIPQCLWERAAAIAASRGVNTVARELRLNATQIKKHMEALPRSQQRPSQGQTATFIEILPLSAPGVIGECAVEIDSPRGSRVRMVMKSVPSTCIADILREFAG